LGEIYRNVSLYDIPALKGRTEAQYLGFEKGVAMTVPDIEQLIKRRYEQQEELRREIERHVDPQVAASRATDKAAIELGQSIVKTGTLLNGGAIVAIPTLVTFFGIETKAVMAGLIFAGGLCTAGLMFSWASALSGFFALGARSHGEHWFAEATKLRFHYSYFPPAENDKNKAERLSESDEMYAKSKRHHKRFVIYRAFSIFLSFLSMVAFILHAPLKPLAPSTAGTLPR
jgi:hypothetical protein